MASEILAIAGDEIRENLVTTAIKFLQHPNVKRCTLESKERFLRNKGLKEAEIQKAISQCAETLDVSSMTSEMMYYYSKKNWLKDNVIPLLVYGGFAYGCYWIYKNYFRHLLFVEQPKKKSTADCIDELRKSLDILNANVTSLRGEMQAVAQAQNNSATTSQLDTIKSDIASVKGILLNRNQFPTLKSRTQPPSIPAWQLQAEEAKATVVVEEKKKQRRGPRSESGGSNSSEGEQATKNSDSSLEIIT